VNTINDGGPAFPVQDASTWQAHGLTLRDYFAAKALTAIYTDPSTVENWSNDPADVDYSEFCAALAYEFADAMLKARQS